MTLTRLDHEGVLQRSRSLLGTLEPQQHVLPWDDPPSFADLQLNIKQTDTEVVRPSPVCIVS